jgi:tetratricopeptide (TPR) repeat protein
MKIWAGLTTCLLGTASAIVLTPLPPISAISRQAPQLQTLARQMSVKIEGQSSGSGVIIARQGQTYTVLTCAHVVASQDEYTLITPDGKKHSLDYKLVRKFANNIDLALVTFNSASNYQVAEMGRSNTLLSSTPIYVAGFPLQGVGTNLQPFQFSEGQLLAQTTQPIARGYTLAYLNETLAGMSGGPVLNQQGQLVGIHGAAISTSLLDLVNRNELGIDPDSGEKDSYLNLAIPIDTFLRSVPQTAPNLKFASVPAVSAPPQLTADDLLVRSIGQFAAGKISGGEDGALTLTNQAIRLQPNYGLAYHYRGILQANLANFCEFTNICLDSRGTRDSRAAKAEYLDAAIADFTETIRLNPSFSSAYLNRGRVRRLTGDKAGALGDYAKVLSLDPNSTSTYHNRAVIRMEQKDYRAAIADLDQAIRLNPYKVVSVTHRGMARTFLGEYQLALVDFDQAIRLNPESYEGYYYRGRTYALLVELPKAIADFSEAIRLRPKSFDAYVRRGLARQKSQDFPGAIADFSEAIRLSPAATDMYINRGLAREKTGDTTGAVADFQQAAVLAGKEGNTRLQTVANYNLKRLKP